MCVLGKQLQKFVELDRSLAAAEETLRLRLAASALFFFVLFSSEWENDELFLYPSRFLFVPFYKKYNDVGRREYKMTNVKGRNRKITFSMKIFTNLQNWFCEMCDFVLRNFLNNLVQTSQMSSVYREVWSNSKQLLHILLLCVWFTLSFKLQSNLSSWSTIRLA